MGWVSTVFTGLVLLLLLAPVILLLGTFFILVPLAHLLPPSPSIARSSFDCPVSRRRVNVAFSTVPGAEGPGDVVSCSAFSDPSDIRCQKGCLALARTRWTPSPMVPRYSLVADGVSFRESV
jgi:hypothetical protein